MAPFGAAVSGCEHVDVAVLDAGRRLAELGVDDLGAPGFHVVIGDAHGGEHVAERHHAEMAARPTGNDAELHLLFNDVLDVLGVELLRHDELEVLEVDRRDPAQFRVGTDLLALDHQLAAIAELGGQAADHGDGEVALAAHAHGVAHRPAGNEREVQPRIGGLQLLGHRADDDLERSGARSAPPLVLAADAAGIGVRAQRRGDQERGPDRQTSSKARFHLKSPFHVFFLVRCRFPTSPSALGAAARDPVRLQRRHGISCIKADAVSIKKHSF